MSKVAKPLTVIVIAIAVAAGAAVFLSRQPAEVPSTSGADASSVDTVSLAGGHFKGPENAPLTLIEFGDYQCPACRAFHLIVTEVMSKYPTQLKLEFHHYPLVQLHANAMGASMTAEAAGEQGKYWEMHDLLFETQPQWAVSQNPEAEFLGLANRLGLNANKFMQDVRSPLLQQRVLEDVVRARDAKVEATPTFFLNGEGFAPGQTVGSFSDFIDKKLATLVTQEKK